MDIFLVIVRQRNLHTQTHRHTDRHAMIAISLTLNRGIKNGCEHNSSNYYPIDIAYPVEIFARNLKIIIFCSKKKFILTSLWRHKDVIFGNFGTFLGID